LFFYSPFLKILKKNDNKTGEINNDHFKYFNEVINQYDGFWYWKMTKLVIFNKRKRVEILL